MSVVDPPAAPEGGSGMRAKNLKNLPIVLQPTGLGTGTSRESGEEYEYVNCNVWILDRSGVVESGTGVQVSWWKAMEQLRHHIGYYVACRPIEGVGNSIELAPLGGDARAVAEKVVESLKAEAADNPAPSPTDDDEPF